MATFRGSTVRWHGDRYTRDIRNQLKQRLLEAARAVEAQVKKNIGEMGPPHSDPGEFPHKITGELQDGVHVKENLTILSVQVICDAPHAMAIEVGTRNMEARPFMRRTLYEMKTQIRGIMLKAIPRQGGQFKFM